MNHPSIHIIFLLASLLLCSGCSQPSETSGQAVSINTDSTQYRGRADSTKVTVNITNFAPNPIYCWYAKNRVLYRLDEQLDTAWVVYNYIPVADISAESLRVKLFPYRLMTFQDTSVYLAVFGTYRLSWTYYTSQREDGPITVLSNSFKIVK